MSARNRRCPQVPGRAALAHFGLVVLLAGTTGSCALDFNTRTLGVPVTMAAPLAQPVPGDSFAVTVRAIHVFWGLAAVRQPSLQHVLAGQLGTGSAVANLTIRARKRLPDLVVTALSLGLISTTAVTYEGVITRDGQ